MSWNPLDWMKPITKAIDIVDQAVVDKDKREELKAELNQLKELTYQMELQTKTVPWVDGLHKMGRQILSFFSLLIPAILLYNKPDIDAAQLAAILAPGGIYNYVKGKGR